MVMLWTFLSPSFSFVVILDRASQFASGLLAGPGSIWVHLGGIVMVQIGYCGWSAGLRPIMRGGAFREFLNTLPIAPQARLGASALLLLTLDFLFFSPLLGGAVWIQGHSVPGLSFYAVKAIIFAGLTLFIEAALVEQVFSVFVAIGVADCALAAGCTPMSGWLSAAFLLTAGLAGALGFVMAGRGSFFGMSRPSLPFRFRQKRQKSARHVDNLMRVPPVVRLQLRCLMQKGAGVIGSLVVTLLLPIGVWALLSVFTYDERSVPVLIVAMGLCAQLSLFAFASLDTAHKQAMSFSKTLPLSRHFWLWRDLGLVSALFVPSALFFLLPLGLHRLVPLTVGGIFFGAYFVLLASLRLMVRVDARWRPMASLSLSAVWITVILREFT